MNTRKLLVSTLMLVYILLSACVPGAVDTQVSTAVPTQTTFSPKLFKIPMHLSFGSGWYVEDNLPDLVTIQNQHIDFGVAFNIVTDAELSDPADGHLIPFPEDFLSWIKSDPDFTDVTSSPVTVAGIEGLQIDAKPIWESTTTNKKLFLKLKDNDWNLVDAVKQRSEHWRFIDLGNVKGEHILILSIAPADQFQSLAPEIQNILNTVVFSKP